MTTLRRMLAAVAAVVLLTGSARAVDQPIVGTKLVLQQTKGMQKLTFVSNDPTLVLPAIGSAGDPAHGYGGAGGMRLALSTMSTAAPGAVLEAPFGATWSTRATPVLTYRYSSSGYRIRRAVLQQGKRIRITAAWTEPPLPGPLGGVAVVVLFNESDRRCTSFGSDAIVIDAPTRFIAKNALRPATADCSAFLATTTTTTPVTTSTTTTLAGVCGDGAVNQASEACDGASLAVCAPAGGCIPSGSPDECQCCYADAVGCDGSGYPSYPCCGGEACARIRSFGLYGASTSVCAKLTCGPGDACTQGASCDDGVCCIGAGAACATLFLWGSTIAYENAPFPCCGALSCAPAGPSPGSGAWAWTCQQVAGRACTTYDDCFPDFVCNAGICS
jgi:hypothetical protein